MKFTYSVGEKDFLNFQLYQFSQSEAFTTKLRKQRMVVALINAGLALFFYAEKKYFLVVGFLIVGAIWYFMYPNRTKRIYKKKFEEEIKANLQSHFNVPAEFEITDSGVRTSDKRGISEKKYTDIKEITHLADTTFITFNSNQAFILSKELTEKYDEMIRLLDEKAAQNSIIVTKDEDWEW